MIKNASVFDEGLYECDYQDKNNTIENRRYLLQIKALPSEIEFVNSTNDTITGIEQQPLSVVCRVKRGKPPETLTLKRRAITVKAGGHGSIVYRFNPEKIDHNIQFLCEAKSPLTSLPLRKTVKINIKYKPMIAIKNDVKEVNEGATLSICSFVDNPPDVKLKFENVTINDKERTMQCIADGTPAVYQYSQWEHRSEYNEHIRYLDTTLTGNLTLPITEFKGDRFQDSGMYLCRVSNGIPNRKGNYEQEGKGYFISTGILILYISFFYNHESLI
ncbi:unnamed protein product [Mytilus coruscus]|uniref:Ig-like domain-containing protein n=1 Tax=Mytilus coruscus TaxID=42192 RepID=A0A6J8B6M8_MYTCO|nr:unnamed protein product [Mytilus coruscus]